MKTFSEINIRGKSIFRTFRNNIANSSGMTFRLTVITCPAGGYNKLKYLQSQESGGIGIYFYRRYNLIKVNIVDLIGLLYLYRMIGVSELLK